VLRTPGEQRPSQREFRLRSLQDNSQAIYRIRCEGVRASSFIPDRICSLREIRRVFLRAMNQQYQLIPDTRQAVRSRLRRAAVEFRSAGFSVGVKPTKGEALHSDLWLP
jgi:hypothetical protein